MNSANLDKLIEVVSNTATTSLVFDQASQTVNTDDGRPVISFDWKNDEIKAGTATVSIPYVDLDRFTTMYSDGTMLSDGKVYIPMMDGSCIDGQVPTKEDRKCNVRPDGVRFHPHPWTPSIGVDKSPTAFSDIEEMLDSVRVDKDGYVTDYSVTQEVDPTRLGYALCSVNGVPKIRRFAQAVTVFDHIPRTDRYGRPIIRADYSVGLTKHTVTSTCAVIQDMLRDNGPQNAQGSTLRRIDTGLVERIVRRVADSNRINPAMEMVEAQEWDGKARLKDLYFTLGYRVPEGLVSEEDERVYMEFVSIVTILGIIERQMHPVIIEYAPVLTGDQGAGKGVTCRFIGNGFHKEAPTLPNIKNIDAGKIRDYMHACRGSTVAEMVEGTQMSSDKIELMKAVVSESAYDAIDKYEKDSQSYDVTWIWMVSSNSANVLKDPTGARRWLPMTAVVDPLEAVRKLTYSEPDYMDQVYAEGYHIIKDMMIGGTSENFYRKWETAKVKEIQKKVCSKYYEHPTYVDELAEYIKGLLAPTGRIAMDGIDCSSAETAYSNEMINDGTPVDQGLYRKAITYMRKADNLKGLGLSIYQPHGGKRKYKLLD